MVSHESDEDKYEGPALLRHMRTIYLAMEASATYDGDEGVYVWTGSLTRLFPDSGVAMSNYTRVTKALRNMNSVQIIQRGGGAQPTMIKLIKKPNLADFNTAKTRGIVGDGQVAQIHGATTAVNERMDKAEQTVTTLARLVKELMDRVAVLEDHYEDSVDDSETITYHKVVSPASMLAAPLHGVEPEEWSEDDELG